MNMNITNHHSQNERSIFSVILAMDEQNVSVTLQILCALFNEIWSDWEKMAFSAEMLKRRTIFIHLVFTYILVSSNFFSQALSIALPHNRTCQMT